MEAKPQRCRDCWRLIGQLHATYCPRRDILMGCVAEADCLPTPTDSTEKEPTT